MGEGCRGKNKISQKPAKRVNEIAEQTNLIPKVVKSRVRSNSPVGYL